MKCSDIMLSLLLHTVLVGGVIYGLSEYEDEIVDEMVDAPVFFEVLEESMMAGYLESDDSQTAEEEDVAKEIAKDAEMKKDISKPAAAECDEETALEKVPESGDEYSGGEVLKPMPEITERPIPPLEPTLPDQVETKPPPQELEKNLHSGASVPESTEPSLKDTAKVVSAPMPIGTISPTYPRSARRRGREGSVTLEISVSDTGDIMEAQVVGSSGHAALDSAAVSAVRSASFAPATEDGVRVQGRLRLTFDFKLR